MKSGILAESEGYDILINAEVRTFRDVWEYAYDAARNLKNQARHRNDVIEIRHRSNGQKQIVLEDGRLA